MTKTPWPSLQVFCWQLVNVADVIQKNRVCFVSVKMISLSSISHSFAGRELFRDLEWSVKKGRKYGLVGPNGSGKTTLLEIVMGLMEPEKGKVSVPSALTVGYLPQMMDSHTGDLSILSAARAGRRGSDEETSEKPAHEAEKILFGLGFTGEQMKEKVSSLSGGWKMRVELARILLTEPRVLLLDEPTNHLDIKSIEWIEGYLGNYSGTVVLVSHDKYLLDRMVDTIAELGGGVIREFRGDYSSYLEKKEQIAAVAEATAKNREKKLQAQRRFIERFRYKASKARQVQSRIKMLEKMEPEELSPQDRGTLEFHFPAPERSGRVVYEISDFSKEYESSGGVKNVVFRNCPALRVERGDRTAVAGKNGEGKTTLCKMIAGVESFSGRSRLGHNVTLGYYAQNQDEMLNPRNTVYEEFATAYPLFSETEARTLLGSFLFGASDITKKVSVLSGGEKSRLSLLKILVSRSNFLVLDEPTNHLDMASKEVLCQALREYSGTFLLISHDRHFIDSLVNSIWYVEGGGVETFTGNYSEFLERKARDSGNRPIPAELQKKQPGRKTAKTLEAERRNRLYRELQEKGIENMEDWALLSKKQMEKALSDLERRISEYESEKEEMEKLLADPESVPRDVDWEEKTRQFGELERKLSALYGRWDEVSEYMRRNSG